MRSFMRKDSQATGRVWYSFGLDTNNARLFGKGHDVPEGFAYPHSQLSCGKFTGMAYGRSSLTFLSFNVISVSGNLFLSFFQHIAGILNKCAATDMAAGVSRFAKILKRTTNCGLGNPDLFCQAGDRW